MRTVLATLAALAVLGAIAGGAVVFIGLYNVSARAGHLPPVAWAMHTTFRNSVELRAPAQEAVPDLADPALIGLGARHFDNACRMCHGAPGVLRSATVRMMEPQPPHITEAVKGWQPAELHWIVYEGAKMTGMPAWPAARPEEVWAVVAFLQQVEGMSAAEYAELVRLPEAPEDDPTLAYCASCHGLDGRSPLAPHVPRLDIQKAPYLALSLDAFHDGWRQSGIMEHAASGLDPEEIVALARHYESVAPAPMPSRPLDPALVALGERLAAATSDEPEVPACRACHGPDADRAAPEIPALAGQHAAYLAAQLRAWRAGHRGGGARANIMHAVATTLGDTEIAALAAYYAALPPAKPTSVAR